MLDRTRGQWLWQETTATGPQPNARRGHTATRIGTRIYIWGGLYGYTKFLADLWVLDTANMEWSQPKMEGTPPSPRAWHSAVAAGNTGKIIFFGGTAGRSKFYNEVWMLDTTGRTSHIPCFVMNICMIMCNEQYQNGSVSI
jgi:N-acetylneuraminic acid mutarotase